LDGVDSVLQRVRLEQYRDNIEGALRLLDEANTRHPDPRLTSEAARIRAALHHLSSREAYAEAYERYYRTKKGKGFVRGLERNLRTLLGWKTRKLVRRRSAHPEFRLLEREVLASQARRVLDAGCGEGHMALPLAARHPNVQVDGIDVSPTNLRLAQRMNRFPNARFHHGFLEDAPRLLPEGAFDLVYCFAVLEHVRNLEEAMAALLRMLRPGGRFCGVVPMNEFVAEGALPEPRYEDGVAGHVRVFTEDDLRTAFGRRPQFVLEKLAGDLPKKYPAGIVPREFGSFFLAFSKPTS
jgi:SAM-dependent methyltransferase